MFKTIWTFRFKGGANREEARQRWRTKHGALIMKLEGVVKYIQNHKVPQTSASEVESAVSWDGVAEVYFNDQGCYARAMKSPEWDAVMADSVEWIDVSSAEVGVVEEEQML